MKRVFIYGIAFLLFGITSCSKECVKCSQIDTYRETLCRKDYNSKEAYDAAVSDYSQIFGMHFE